jgi:hypothetical protein
MITINTQELVGILDKTPVCQNIMLVGHHGIGKSQILTSYYNAKGIRVQSLFLGQMSDPGDLIGLPRMNEKTGRTDFSMPFWFPNDGEPVVLFLDELNRARPELLQSVMDLALNRKLSGHELPKGSRIISAVNDGEEYQLTELDPALVSRFNIYEFRPTVDEWLVWAEENKLDKRVVDFIASDQGSLDGGGTKLSDSCLETSPDRRAWERVSGIIKDEKVLDDLVKKAVAGVIGLATTQKFFAYANSEKQIDGRKVLLEYDKYEEAISQSNLAEFALLDDSIFRFLQVKGYPKGKEEMVAQNLRRYLSKCISGRKELMAHFVSCYKNSIYSAARTFILINAPEISTQMTEYIRNL